jgi:hypothetical protein
LALKFINALKPKEFTPPAFQLEVKLAWLRLRPALNAFFQCVVESILIICASEVLAKANKRKVQTITEQLTNDLCFIGLRIFLPQK